MKIRTTSCGCCTNGCCCWNHMDIPMGRPPVVCGEHAVTGHPRVTSPLDDEPTPAPKPAKKRGGK